MKSSVGIDLVLGAGGARSLCAIGALRVLEAEGVEIKRVLGASMGAIIGAAYCAQIELREIEKALKGQKLSRLINPSWSGPGLCSNSGVRRMIAELLGDTTFSTLRIPLAVHCTDLQTGEGVAFDRGDLVSILTGSSLAAGIYNPVEYNGRLLVDGGYSNPVPAYLSTNRVVCAVDPTVIPDWDVAINSSSWVDTRAHKVWRMGLKSIDILIWNLAKVQLGQAGAILVQPRMSGIQFTEFAEAEQVVSAGEAAMLAAMPELRRRMIEVQ